MGDIEAVPVTGIWVRHVPANADPMDLGREASAGRWQPEGTAALYLAADESTAWAEWYRHLAERGIEPLGGVPRDLWRFAVRLTRVADLSTPARRARADLAALAPDRANWPAFQELGALLAATGWDGVLSASAARPTGLVLCVYAAAASTPRVRQLPPPKRVERPPAPPTGMRT